MAECSISIDKNKLPGVKEVCRDFAVLEDHSLAYNLQEQEIESHLASNVHKSRLVQQDLQWAKKLQMEEDEIAKTQSQKQNKAIARQDNEIAQEIQEELVRQEELQRLQEEKDAAIARQLQEKEKIREERRKQKQMEANIQEDYYEDRGAAQPLDLDKHTRHKSQSPGRHDLYSLERSPRDHTPDYHSTDPKRSGYPKQDSTAPHSRSKYPEQYLGTEGGRTRHADPEHLLPSRGKHEDRNPEFESAHTGRAREGGREADRVVRKKERPERPPRPPSPNSPLERDEVLNRERQRHNRERDCNLDRRVEKDYRRDREQDLRPVRDRDEFRDQGTSGDRHREQDRPRQKDKDRQRGRDRGLEEDFLQDERRGRSRDRGLEEDFLQDERRGRSRDRGLEEDFLQDERRGRSRDRGLEEDFLQDRQRGRSRDRGLEVHSLEQGRSRDRPRESRSSLGEDEVDGERRARSQQRVHSNPVEMFDVNVKGRGDGETWDPQQGNTSHTYSNKETGRIVHKGSGAVIPETEYGLSEATQGLATLDLHEQELKDMEVARRLQEEEIKASNMHVRAAQMAKDEEIARRMAEHEKKEYRKNREREKERERERLASEKMGMERRRHEGSYRANSEEIVRPRTRDEYDHQRQRNHHKPARPPQPRTHDYENVNPGYGHPAASRPTTRPDAAYRGAYHKQ